MAAKTPLRIYYDDAGSPSGLAEFQSGDYVASQFLEGSAIGSAIDLSSLADVSAQAPTAGQGVIWDGANWSASTISVAAGASDLSSLTDTSISDVIERTYLTIEDGSWVASGPVEVSATQPVSAIGKLWYDTNASATVGNSNVLAIETKTETYTMTSNNDVVLVDCTASSVSGTLPAASGVDVVGKVIEVKKIDSSTNAAVVLTEGENIDNFSSASLVSQNDALRFISNSDQWWILA